MLNATIYQNWVLQCPAGTPAGPILCAHRLQGHAAPLLQAGRTSHAPPSSAPPEHGAHSQDRCALNVFIVNQKTKCLRSQENDMRPPRRCKRSLIFNKSRRMHSGEGVDPGNLTLQVLASLTLHEERTLTQSWQVLTWLQYQSPGLSENQFATCRTVTPMPTLLSSQHHSKDQM